VPEARHGSRQSTIMLGLDRAVSPVLWRHAGNRVRVG